MPRPLDAGDAPALPSLSRPGDLVPPCAVQALGSLAEFSGDSAGRYPPDLHPLRVFKCRKMFLLVMPGLREDRPNAIEGLGG